MENEGFKLNLVSIRLVEDSQIFSDQSIKSPQDAINLLGKELSSFDREVVAVINLKTNGVPINVSFVSIGALNHAIAHPRELFKTAILSNAHSMIMIHNHVSGSLAPSEEDVIITDKMIKLSNLIGISLLDHIIISPGNKEFFSFKEKCILRTDEIRKNIKDCNELKFEDSEIYKKINNISVKKKGR